MLFVAIPSLQIHMSPKVLISLSRTNHLVLCYNYRFLFAREKKMQFKRAFSFYSTLMNAYDVRNRLWSLYSFHEASKLFFKWNVIFSISVKASSANRNKFNDLNWSTILMKYSRVTTIQDIKSKSHVA